MLGVRRASLQFLIGHLLRCVAVVIAVLSVVFVLLRLSGDPVVAFLPPSASESEIRMMRSALGYDLPLLRQYARFLARAAAGDFGTSVRYGVPAMSLVLERLPATGCLVGLSVVLAIGLGIPLGVAWGTSRGAKAQTINALCALRLATPSFWLGLHLIALFSTRFGVFPIGERGGALRVALPVFTLASYLLCQFVRLIRAGLQDILRQDYLVVAAAKGLSRRTVLYRHALRNCLPVIADYVGVELGTMLLGVVVIETVFGWPGVGRLITQAVYNRDFPVVQAAVTVTSGLLVIIDLGIELWRHNFDPRLRTSETGHPG